MLQTHSGHLWLEGETVIGIGEIRGNEICTVAVTRQGCGEAMVRALVERIEGQAVVVQTASTNLRGFIDGILDGTIPKEREREYLQSVSEEVKRLSRLVRSMLEASRLQDQNGGQVQKQAFDLCELLGRGFWQVKQPRAILARSRGGRNGPPLSHGKEE